MICLSAVLADSSVLLGEAPAGFASCSLTMYHRSLVVAYLLVRAVSIACLCGSVPHVTFVLQMNVDKLKKMAGAVRTGGKGSMRRCLFSSCSSHVLQCW